MLFGTKLWQAHKKSEQLRLRLFRKNILMTQSRTSKCAKKGKYAAKEGITKEKRSTYRYYSGTRFQKHHLTQVFSMSAEEAGVEFRRAVERKRFVRALLLSIIVYRFTFTIGFF